MAAPKRKQAFVLVSTAHGPIIVNRLEVQPGDPRGHQLLEQGAYESHEIGCALDLLTLRRSHYGDGVFAIDCGANIGVHTVEWSKLMTGWGHVLSFEAQERIYYALAGNVALNNCFNARVLNAAVGNVDGIIGIPQPDYLKEGRYGSMNLKPGPSVENIGQPISYDPAHLAQVRAFRLDSLTVSRVDLIKLDVEGMEIEAIEGAKALIAKHRPYLIIEVIKTDRNRLAALLVSLGYKTFPLGRLDILAVHSADKALATIERRDWAKEAS
jgi:FkbM family methyltransferase